MKKKYRIKEVVYGDDRREFYPQYLGVVLQQQRSVLNPRECIFVDVEDWITINKGGLSNNTYEECLEIIKFDNRSLEQINEIIHEIKL